MSSATEIANAFKIGPEKVHEKVMPLPAWASKLLVANFITVLISVSAAAWWASQMAADMSYLRIRIAVIESTLDRNNDDRYRGRDAERDFRVRDETINRLHMRISELERKASAGK